MPAGTPKVALFGGKVLVPGGTQTFNAPGTFTVPTGITTVSITGKGSPGNPGNAGNSAPPNNPGQPLASAGGGGGGAGTFRYYRVGGPGCCFNPAPQVGTYENSNPGGPFGNGGHVQCIGGFTGGSPTLNNGNPGVAGKNQTPGNPGNAGNPGTASTGLSQTFPGGNAGNAGTGGNGGNGGNGGSGGNVGIRNTVWFALCVCYCPCNGSYFVNSQGYLENYGNQVQAGGGGSGGNGGGSGISVSYGGGGAGTVNDGQPGNVRPGPGSPGAAGGSCGGGTGGNRPSPSSAGGASGHRRAGGGGGAGGCGQGTGGGGGGGGGRGNAGNPGNPGGTGGTANPSTFNSISVTPGSSYPISVASPGGQVVISWNPQ